MMLTFLTSALLVGAACLTCLLVLASKLRRRRAGEPPIVKGSILFGSAADFGRNAVEFLHKARAVYGEVFTIRLINQHLTIIMDPNSYETMSSERNFDFDPIQKQVNGNVFNFVLREPKKMIKETGRTVKGKFMQTSMDNFVNNLNVACQRVYEEKVDSGSSSSATVTTTDKPWATGGLRAFTASTAFDAIFNTVFGRSDTFVSDASSSSDESSSNTTQTCSRKLIPSATSSSSSSSVPSSAFASSSSTTSSSTSLKTTSTCCAGQQAFNASSVYGSFEVYHKYFNYLWLGMPQWWFPMATQALKQLLVMPDSAELLQRSDLSVYIRTAIGYMLEHGQSEADIKGHNLVYLHVNFNSFRLSFWVLNNLLENQDALEALREEVEDMVAARLDSETNVAELSLEDVEGMKILDSVVQETSRLSSGVFMVRYVTADTQFKTSDGQVHLIRKGDRVAIYPPAIHKDPEIFEDPLVFKYNRFVDAKFYSRDGQTEIKHPVMTFGSLCPGKRYALLQIKWFILTAMTRFDMRIPAGAQRAQYDYHYHGHEILPPVSDVAMEFRPKDSCPILSFSQR